MKTTFSIFARIKSFRYAFKGIWYMLSTQHNSWIHTILTCLVIIFGIIYKINLTEWCLVVLAMGLVFALETMNTALEELVNLVSPTYNKKAGIIKDVAAGAVLLAAMAAAAIGLIIFVPKIF